MTILTFPWDDVGRCSGLEPYDECFTIRHQYGGYRPTRPATTRKVKGFKISHKMMTMARWLALIEFWRQVGSHDAFYWEFPIAMWDVGAWGGDDMGVEDPGGWDSEGDGTGFGAGPNFLVQFKDDVISQKHIKPFYWGVSYVLIEV